MELCPNVYSEFALVLTTLLQQNLDGHVDFVGESGAPEILYWFRKAADTVHITSQDQLLLQDLNFLGKKSAPFVGSRATISRLASDVVGQAIVAESVSWIIGIKATRLIVKRSTSYLAQGMLQCP